MQTNNTKLFSIGLRRWIKGCGSMLLDERIIFKTLDNLLVEKYERVEEEEEKR